eukprot:11205630-Lingulodinium_polyedra.AAC.1
MWTRCWRLSVRSVGCATSRLRCGSPPGRAPAWVSTSQGFARPSAYGPSDPRSEDVRRSGTSGRRGRR